jgi:hypothetical protein
VLDNNSGKRTARGDDRVSPGKSEHTSSTRMCSDLGRSATWLRAFEEVETTKGTIRVCTGAFSSDVLSGDSLRRRKRYKA